MQGELAAIKLRVLDQPVGLLVERCQAFAHIVLVFHGEVGHQRDQLEVLLVGDLQRFATAGPVAISTPLRLMPLELSARWMRKVLPWRSARASSWRANSALPTSSSMSYCRASSTSLTLAGVPVPVAR